MNYEVLEDLLVLLVHHPFKVEVKRPIIGDILVMVHFHLWQLNQVLKLYKIAKGVVRSLPLVKVRFEDLVPPLKVLWILDILGFSDIFDC